ncbi:MAG TPA: ADP-ribosylglycohydrolase family protein [Blastocatellia bacterium]|nr:ADP-ribosylglycohydrolase family protein [Blastocatellia bacterium]
MVRKNPRRMALQSLEDKIRGGWAGQMIGVAFGAPTEFRHLGKTIEGDLPWSPDRVANALKQDDLYVEMTFAEVMDRVGLDAAMEQYGEAFRDSKYDLWHANAAARRNLLRGIKPPMSGHPDNNLHANDIDFQIEADFIGLMTPGLPREANKYCDRVGRVMNYGDGLFGGMFVCGMYAAAFFERDVRKIVEQGLACIPAESGYGKIIRDVLDWSQQHPDDWKKTWQLAQEKWDRGDPCPDGAQRPFNIDAKLNGAYIAIGLLYGKGDFAKTIEITTRCGQDSDCNPASAAGVLGVMLGYRNIPDEWKSGIEKIADEKFEHTNYSFNDITRSTLARALKIIQRAGGVVKRNLIIVPHQEPLPPLNEQWSPGVPEKIVQAKDGDWDWRGAWKEFTRGEDKRQFVGMMAEGSGAEATLTFTGAAVALVGRYLEDGGRADVYLDGKKVGELDAYTAAANHDNDLWRMYDLQPGAHKLRIVTRNDADARSQGKKVLIERAIIFRK